MTRIIIGATYRISDNSGVDSGKTVIAVSRQSVKLDNHGIPVNIQGAYKPVDWRREVAIQFEDGRVGVMFKNRLTKI